MSEKVKPFEHWCIVELMGRVKMAGLVTDPEFGGGALFQIDIPGDNGFTQLFGKNSIYRMTLCGEKEARLAAQAFSTPRPITRWELQELYPLLEDGDGDDDLDDWYVFRVTSIEGRRYSESVTTDLDELTAFRTATEWNNNSAINVRYDVDRESVTPAAYHDSVLPRGADQAVAENVQDLIADDERAHKIVRLECYKSNSGNTTWKAYDETDWLIYLRQSNRAQLEEFGLWDGLSEMEIGETRGCDFVIISIQDGDFRKPVRFEGDPLIFAPDHVEERPDADTLRQRDVVTWAKGLIERGFVILDSETTGLNEDRADEPVQISVIDHTGEVLFSSLVRPTITIDPEAARVHGLDGEKINLAPTFRDIRSQLQTVLQDKELVIYNAAFDLAVLDNASIANDPAAPDGRLPLPSTWPRKTHCAMLEYAQYHGEPWRRGGWKNQKLTAAAKQLGVPVKDAHDATGDCVMTLGVIQALAAIDI